MAAEEETAAEREMTAQTMAVRTATAPPPLASLSRRVVEGLRPYVMALHAANSSWIAEERRYEAADGLRVIAEELALRLVRVSYHPGLCPEPEWAWAGGDGPGAMRGLARAQWAEAKERAAHAKAAAYAAHEALEDQLRGWGVSLDQVLNRGGEAPWLVREDDGSRTPGERAFWAPPANGTSGTRPGVALFAAGELVAERERAGLPREEER